MFPLAHGAEGENLPENVHPSAGTQEGWGLNSPSQLGAETPDRKVKGKCQGWSKPRDFWKD